MKNKLKIFWILFATFSVIACISVPLIFVLIELFFGWSPPVPIIERICNTCANVMFAIGIPFVISLFFINIEIKPAKADKFALTFDCYENLKMFSEQAIVRKGYLLYDFFEFDLPSEITFYFKQIKKREIDSIAIIRIDELTDEILEKLNNQITEIVCKYYNLPANNITDTINMISVFCVNRITPTFRKMVNTPAIQDIKNGRLPVGISFGGKNVYIPQDVSGIFSNRLNTKKYKRLRLELCEILNLQKPLNTESRKKI